MKRRFDKFYGYWWVKPEGGSWKREHHHVWEAHGNSPVPRGFVIHHRDENKENNEYSNLELLSRGDHARLHARGRKMSPKSIQKMKAAAKLRCSDPEHRLGMSERAKAQHKAKNLGAHTWTEEGRESVRQKSKLNGLRQASRLRSMIAATPSTEMSRRSYKRKLFDRKANALRE